MNNYGSAAKTKPSLRFPGFTNSWEYKKLGTLAKRSSDKNKTSSAVMVLTNSAVRGVVPQSDFFNKEIAVQGNLSNYRKVQLDDFVYNPRISISSPVGPFKRNHYGEGVMSPLYTIYRFNNSENLDFFETFFSTNKWHKYMKSVANYGARHDRMAISSTDLDGIPLPYPVQSEQVKIAKLFKIIDAKVELQSNKIKKLNEYKKGVMQSIFSQQARFKDDHGNNYPNWQLHKAGSIFKNLSNKNHNGELPVLAVTQDRGIVRRDSLAKKIDSSQEGINNYKIIEPGDFVISLRSFQGGIEMSKVRGISSPAYTVFRQNDNTEVYPDFFRFYFKKESFISQLSGAVVGIREGKQISYSVFADIQIPIPTLEEQKKISQFLSTIDKKIDLEKSVYKHIKNFRKILLQEMYA